eukprot:Gb_31926 [translate_table: standard]
MESTSVNGFYQQRQDRRNNDVGNYWQQGYGEQMTEDNDLEEGEACDDASKYDPDVAFAYLDVKLQNVLGHLQKEFEGGVSADKLGSKFGGYGSFLPTQERSPSLLLQPKTPAIVQKYSLSKSQKQGSVEHICDKAKSSVNAAPPTKSVSVAIKNPSVSGALASNFAHEGLMALNGAKCDEASSGTKVTVATSVTGGNQKKLKLRFKVGSDSLLRTKNNAIYSGLGLQLSSSPSLEDSPDKNQKFSTEAEYPPDLSPLSIIQIMTSYQIPGNSPLSPLQSSLLELSVQKEEPSRKDVKGCTGKTNIFEEPSNSHGSDYGKDVQGKKGTKDTTNGIMDPKKEPDAELQGAAANKVNKDAEINCRTAKESGYNNWKLQCKEEAYQERSETAVTHNVGKENLKGTDLTTEALKSQTKDRDIRSCLSRNENKEADVSRDPNSCSKTGGGLLTKYKNEKRKEHGEDQVKEARKEFGHKDFVSDVRKTGKESVKAQKKFDLSQDFSNAYKEKTLQKDEKKGVPKEKIPVQVVTHEMAGIKKEYGKEVGSENKGRQNMDASKKALKKKSKDVLRETCKESRKETFQKDSFLTENFDGGVKGEKQGTKADVKDFYRDGVKNISKEHADVKKGINVTCKLISKQVRSEHFEGQPSWVIEREKNRDLVDDASMGKAHASNDVVTQPSSVQTADVDAGLAQAAPTLFIENWVACDACEKWRLLPFGVETSFLPKKWLCRMLHWLPGMNRCEFSEDQTTQALYALYKVQPGQSHTETNQGQLQLPVAPVSTPLPDIKQAHQIQELNSLKLNSKFGNSKKGHVQKAMPNVQDTARLSISHVRKKEIFSAKDKNDVSQLPSQQSEGSTGVSHLAHEGNLNGARRHKDQGREKGKLKQMSESQGHDTEVPNAHTKKLKRKREDDLKGSKAAKTSKAEGRETEIVDSTPLQIKHKNDPESGKLLGGKTKKLKDTPKSCEHEISDCSLSRKCKFKDQQQACILATSRGGHGDFDTGKSDKKDYSAKKRKLEEWKESQASRQGCLERDRLLDCEVSMKEESETEHRRETFVKTERREPSANGADYNKDGKKQQVNKLSSNQELMLDEMEDKSRGVLSKECEASQSRGHGVTQRVSDVTESLKRDSVCQPPFVSATSSSSKVSCYPKTLGTFQDVRGSPVESTVSSSPVKLKKLSFARSNGAVVDGLMDTGCLRIHSPRRCYDGEEDAQSDRSGPIQNTKNSSCEAPASYEDFRVVQSNACNMARAVGDRGGRDGKNIHKKQCMGANDVEHFRSECNNCHLSNGTNYSESLERFSNEMRKPDGNQEEYSEHNITYICNESSGGMLKSLRGQEKRRERTVYNDKGVDKLDSYSTDGDDKDYANERNVRSECVQSGRRKASKGNQMQQNTDENAEIPRFDSQVKRHPDSISRGKTGSLPCKDGKPSSRQHCGRERVSDRSLSERNTPAEMASSKVKPKPSSHSANRSDGHLHGHNSGEKILPKKSTQDASSGESSRAPRESGAVGNGALSCNLRPPLLNGFSGRDTEGAIASPIKEHLQTVANAALKEATDLKHRADRLKNVGGDELGCTSLYFRASLKFLHGASILEPSNTDSAKHGETQSVAVYRDTARLCEYCAIVYERNKELAAAALAYKCMGVAHMRVVVAKNVSISRDRHDLQAAAQMIPLGESPSSSASDVDNLNNHVLMDRDPSMNTTKGVRSLQGASNQVIVARHRPHIDRILQYTQDVNAALEAFAKATFAFAAANDSNIAAEKLSAVKRAVDFNFHDVDGLLRLVLLAMESINH